MVMISGCMGKIRQSHIGCDEDPELHVVRHPEHL